MTAHGGPRYDTQWADVLDAEKWGDIGAMADAGLRAWRVAEYFTRAREALP